MGEGMGSSGESSEVPEFRSAEVPVSSRAVWVDEMVLEAQSQQWGKAICKRRLVEQASALDRAEGTLFNSQGRAAALSRVAPGCGRDVIGPLKEGGWFVRFANGALSGPGPLRISHRQPRSEALLAAG